MTRSPRTARCLGLLLLCICVPLSGCSIFCPSPVAEIVDNFSLATPEGAYYSFKRALRENSPSYEFRCLSYAFLEANGIDQQKYRVGRNYFKHRYRKEISRFLASSIEEVRPFFGEDGTQYAQIILTDGELEGEFILVNEPYWQIHPRANADHEEPYPIFGWLEPGDRIEGHMRREGDRLVVDFEITERWKPRVDEIAGVEFKDEWKVFQFVGMGEAFQTDEEEEGDDADPAP